MVVRRHFSNNCRLQYLGVLVEEECGHYAVYGVQLPVQLTLQMLQLWPCQLGMVRRQRRQSACLALMIAGSAAAQRSAQPWQAALRQILCTVAAIAAAFVRQMITKSPQLVLQLLLLNSHCTPPIALRIELLMDPLRSGKLSAVCACIPGDAMPLPRVLAEPCPLGGLSCRARSPTTRAEIACSDMACSAVVLGWQLQNSH